MTTTPKPKDPEADAKAAEKDTKKVFESYFEVAKHQLGRAPTPDEVMQVMNQSKEVEKSEFPQAESVPMPNMQQEQPEQQEAETDKGPAILHMKIYHGVKDGQPDPDGILFYEHPSGLVYDCDSQEWLPSRPAILDRLLSRPMGFMERDIMSAILNGVMSDDDYEALDSRSMIGEHPRKLWELNKKLKTQIDELERAKDMSTDDALKKSDDDFDGEESEEEDVVDVESEENESEEVESEETEAQVTSESSEEPDLPGDNILQKILETALSPGNLGPYIEAAVRKVMSEKSEPIGEKPIDTE